MTNLIIILAVLFAALFVTVTLVERYGKPTSDEQLRKLSRFIFPLMGLILILSAIRYFFFHN